MPQSTSTQNVTQTDSLLARVDDVLTANRRHEYCYIFGAAILFITGIASFLVALYHGEYVWTVPPAAATFFLRWPLNAIHQIRKDNLALAIVPAIIKELPRPKAAEELQKLIQRLYGD